MAPLIQKFESFYYDIFPVMLMSFFLSVIPAKLSMMQTDGLLTFGAGFVTSLFALTSLLYARARAISEPAEMLKRANIADEALKAGFIAVIGFGVTAFSYLCLSDYYAPRAGHPLDSSSMRPEFAPALVAILCTLLFAIPTVIKINRVVELTIKDMGLKK